MQEPNVNSFWLRRAKKRLLNEYKQLSDNPPNNIIVRFKEENILEWHFRFTGLKGSPFEGGEYHGVLTFPENFPFSPPSIRFITPNGRFKVNERVCFALSDFHPECWKPAYTVSAVLQGVYSFMMSETSETVGSLRWDEDGILSLARKSKEFNGKDATYRDLFRDKSSDIFQQVLEISQDFRVEEKKEHFVADSHLKPSELRECSPILSADSLSEGASSKSSNTTLPVHLHEVSMSDTSEPSPRYIIHTRRDQPSHLAKISLSDVTKQSEKLDYERTQFYNGEITELSCVKKQDTNTTDSVNDYSSLIPQTHSIATDEYLEYNSNLPNNVSTSTARDIPNNAVENLDARTFSTNFSSESQIHALGDAKDKAGKYTINGSSSISPFTREHAPITSKENNFESRAKLGNSYTTKSRDSSTNKTEYTNNVKERHGTRISNLVSDLSSSGRTHNQNILAETDRQKDISTKSKTLSTNRTEYSLNGTKQKICSSERPSHTQRHETDNAGESYTNRSIASEEILKNNPEKSKNVLTSTTENTRNTVVERQEVPKNNSDKDYYLDIPHNRTIAAEKAKHIKIPPKSNNAGISIFEYPYTFTDDIGKCDIGAARLEKDFSSERLNQINEKNKAGNKTYPDRSSNSSSNTSKHTPHAAEMKTGACTSGLAKYHVTERQLDQTIAAEKHLKNNITNMSKDVSTRTTKRTPNTALGRQDLRKNDLANNYALESNPLYRTTAADPTNCRNISENEYEHPQNPALENHGVHMIFSNRSGSKSEFVPNTSNEKNAASTSCLANDHSSERPLNWQSGSGKVRKDNPTKSRTVSARTSEQPLNTAAMNHAVQTADLAKEKSSDKLHQNQDYKTHITGKRYYQELSKVININGSTNLSPLTPEHAPSTAKASTAIVGDSYPNKSRDSSIYKTEHTANTTLEHSARKSNLASDLSSERPKYQNIPAETGQQMCISARFKDASTNITEAPHITAVRKQYLCAPDSEKNQSSERSMQNQVHKAGKSDANSSMHLSANISQLPLYDALEKEYAHTSDLEKYHASEISLSQTIVVETTQLNNPTKSRNVSRTENSLNGTKQKIDGSISFLPKRHSSERLPHNRSIASKEVLENNSEKSKNESSASTTEHTRGTLVKMQEVPKDNPAKDHSLDVPHNRTIAAEKAKTRKSYLDKGGISNINGSTNIPPSTSEHEPSIAKAKHHASTTIVDNSYATKSMDSSTCNTEYTNNTKEIHRTRKSNLANDQRYVTNKGSESYPKRSSNLSANTAELRSKTAKGKDYVPTSSSAKYLSPESLLQNQRYGSNKSLGSYPKRSSKVSSNDSKSITNTTERSDSTQTSGLAVVHTTKIPLTRTTASQQALKDKSIKYRNESKSELPPNTAIKQNGTHTADLEKKYSSEGRLNLCIDGDKVQNYNIPNISTKITLKTVEQSRNTALNRNMYKENLGKEYSVEKPQSNRSIAADEAKSCFSENYFIDRSQQTGGLSQKTKSPPNPMKSCHNSLDFPEISDSEFFPLKSTTYSANSSSVEKLKANLSNKNQIASPENLSENRRSYGYIRKPPIHPSTSPTNILSEKQASSQENCRRILPNSFDPSTKNRLPTNASIDKNRSKYTTNSTHVPAVSNKYGVSQNKSNTSTILFLPSHSSIVNGLSQSTEAKKIHCTASETNGANTRFKGPPLDQSYLAHKAEKPKISVYPSKNLHEDNELIPGNANISTPAKHCVNKHQNYPQTQVSDFSRENTSFLTSKTKEGLSQNYKSDKPATSNAPVFSQKRKVYQPQSGSRSILIPPPTAIKVNGLPQPKREIFRPPGIHGSISCSKLTNPVKTSGLASHPSARLSNNKRFQPKIQTPSAKLDKKKEHSFKDNKFGIQQEKFSNPCIATISKQSTNISETSKIKSNFESSTLSSDFGIQNAIFKDFPKYPSYTSSSYSSLEENHRILLKVKSLSKELLSQNDKDIENCRLKGFSK